MTSTNRSSQVGRNIRAELARAGKTQAQAAAVLNMSAMALSRRLRGDVAADINELYALADFLNVPVWAFLDGHSPADHSPALASGDPHDQKAAS